MQDYWAALAIAGDPNGKTAIARERPQWERWNPANPQAMFFGQGHSGMEPGKPRAEFCKFAEAY
jgi:para-nitrobenzyl esterase